MAELLSEMRQTKGSYTSENTSSSQYSRDSNSNNSGEGRSSFEYSSNSNSNSEELCEEAQLHDDSDDYSDTDTSDMPSFIADPNEIDYNRDSTFRESELE